MLLVTLGHTPGQFAAEVGRSMMLYGTRAHKSQSPVLLLPGLSHFKFFFTEIAHTHQPALSWEHLRVDRDVKM